MRSWKRAAVVTAVLGLLACGREEDGVSGGTPIVETRVRTPRSAARVGAALSAHTPRPRASKPAASKPPTKPSEAPVAKTDRTKEKAPAESPTEVPEKAADPPEPTPAAVAKVEPTPEPTPIRLLRRAIAVRGVELAESPGGEVLGEFQGRTDVEVLEDREGWSRVRTAVIDGGSIEGWLKTSQLGDPAAKPADGRAPTERKPTKARADAVAKAPAAAAAPAKKPAGNGPDNIELVPIAGTAKKRPATPFTHKAHWEDYSIKCETCHHPVKAKGGAVPSYSCSSSGCHTANECNGEAVAKKNKACPSFEDAFHMQCIDCHKKDGGPTKCAECHAG